MELISGSGVLLGGEIASGVITIRGLSCRNNVWGFLLDRSERQGYKKQTPGFAYTPQVMNCTGSHGWCITGEYSSQNSLHRFGLGRTAHRPQLCSDGHGARVAVLFCVHMHF